MIIIKFIFFGAKVTWEVHNNYVGIVVFLIGVWIGMIYKYRRNKKLKNISRKAIYRTKGGKHLSDCFEPDSAYEMTDEDLKKIIYHILEADNPRPPVLPITAQIVFLAKAILVNNIGAQIGLVGVQTALTNAKNIGFRLALGLGGGIFAAILGFANPATYIISALFVGGFMINSHFGDIKCHELTQKLDVLQSRVASSDKLPPSKNKIIVMPEKSIAQKEAITFYVEQSKLSETCIEEIELSGSVLRKCSTEKKYKPLNQKTNTLSDLKREDASNIYKKAKADFNKPEEKTEKILKQDERKYLRQRRDVPLKDRTKTLSDLKKEETAQTESENSERISNSEEKEL